MASNSISTFAILSQRGDTIISREFREDTGSVHRAAEIFFRAARFGVRALTHNPDNSDDTDGMKRDYDDNGEETGAPPVFELDGINYISMTFSSGLYFLCTTKYNVSPNLFLELLSRLAKNIRDFLGVLTEESIRKNFVLVYEVLDEVLDFGFPQQTSTEVLKQFVWNDPISVSASAASFKVSTLGRLSSPAASASAMMMNQSVFQQGSKLASSLGFRFPTTTSTSMSSGGKPRNEIFVDILERISFLFSASGHIVNSEVDGSIVMKSFLHNNPELRVSLNENLVIGGSDVHSQHGVYLDDASFHECVNLNEFETHKSLLFVPPEGEFVLMTYRVKGIVHPPFRISPVVEEKSPTQLEVYIRVRAEFTSRNYGANVTIRFPVPKQTSAVSLSSNDHAEYHPHDHKVVWTIKKFQGGGTEVLLRAKITLKEPNAHARREVGPISMEFEVPMLSTSNLQVRSLKTALPPQYGGTDTPHRWVRYITQAGSYVCRVNS